MTNLYMDALKKAEQELAETDATAEELDRRRAKLRQTIAVLRSQVGIDVQPDETITDAILLVVKAWNGFVSAAEVMDRLVLMGHQVQTSTVATILSRLAKSQVVIAGRGSNSNVGYAWPESTSASERLTAMSQVAKKSKPR